MYMYIWLHMCGCGGCGVILFSSCSIYMCVCAYICIYIYTYIYIHIYIIHMDAFHVAHMDYSHLCNMTQTNSEMTRFICETTLITHTHVWCVCVCDIYFVCLYVCTPAAVSLPLAPTPHFAALSHVARMFCVFVCVFVCVHTCRRVGAIGANTTFHLSNAFILCEA